MADIQGNYFCCVDCAMFIANDDSSALDLYEDSYRVNWEEGRKRAAASLPDGTPVVEDAPSGDNGEDEDAVEFHCDYCWRNVFSRKYRLTFNPPLEQFKCCCAGQGGSVYSALCPMHDSSVDTSDPAWRKWYDAHQEAQRQIKERLGWT